MKNQKYPLPALFLLAALAAGCSGMGTTMTRVGRMGQNKGYEIGSEMPLVQQASLDVLKARGYETSVKADPENGAEGAGQIVIGQRVVKYSAAAGAVAPASEAPKEMNTRDLVNVYLSKKWQMGSNVAAPGITLVDIVGGSYLRKTAGGTEVETPLTDAYIALMRDEIERNVSAARAVKALVK
jgi:hypothetical protein